MLTARYHPTSLKEVIGQGTAAAELVSWLKRNKKGRALMLHGPSGSGKNCLVETAANELGYELIAVSASDSRTADQLRSSIGFAGSLGTLNNNKRLLLVDEVDSLATEDRGAVPELLRTIRSSVWPVILTATNPWDKKLRELRTLSDLLPLQKIPTIAIERHLFEIAKKEKHDITLETIKRIAEVSEGDIRAAMNDLEVAAAGERDRLHNMFEVLGSFFRAKNIETARRALGQSGLDPEELFVWVEANLPAAYAKENLSLAYQSLAKIDAQRRRLPPERLLDMLATLVTIPRNAHARFAAPDRNRFFTAERYRANWNAKEKAAALHCSMSKYRSEYELFFKSA
jgi:replication factor C large subunit